MSTQDPSTDLAAQSRSQLGICTVFINFVSSNTVARHFPPNRVLVLTARTLNATGQSRVTLSPLKEHLRAACSPRQEENVPNSV